MDSEPGLDRGSAGPRSEPAAGGAGSYGELDVPGLQAIVREQLAPSRGGGPARATWVQVEILAALWSHGFLFADQIWRRWWPAKTRRWAYSALRRMTQAGWVDRYRLILAQGGSHQRFYGLAEPGFELARGRRLRERQGVARDASWQHLIVDDRGGRLPRELHVNGWVLALEQLAGELVTGWRGPAESRLMPPRRRVRGQWADLRPAEIVLGTSHRLTGYQTQVLEPVNPHATIELHLPAGARVELMIDYEHSDDPFETEQRLRRYDLFTSGWAHLLDRYRPPGRAPIVVFVCPDQPTLDSAVETADRAVTTQIAKAGTSELDWPFPGRRSILFALESDIHDGSMRAFALDALTPQIRAQLAQQRVTAQAPTQVEIIDPQLLPHPPPTVHSKAHRSSFRSSPERGTR